MWRPALERAVHPEHLNTPRQVYDDWAGIGTSGACHLLRHACATHMLENGVDIRYIQALLGHADLRSTQIYTQVSIARLKEVHAATHLTGVVRAK